MNIIHIYHWALLLSVSLAFTQIAHAANVFGKNKSFDGLQKIEPIQNRVLIHKFQDIRHMSSSVIRRLIELGEEEARLENEIRMEQEKREKIYREYLASRHHASFLRDFLTSRY